jgi:hypothetical protein
MKNHINKKKLCNKVKFDINPRDYEEVILKEDNSETKLFEEIVNLKSKIKELTTATTTAGASVIVKGNNNVTNSNNIIININAFDKPNVGFLEDKDYRRCISRIINSVPQMIKKIHFDPDHPENHNIYISNLRNNMAMCYDGVKWNMCKQDRLIDDLIKNNEMALTDWLESGETEHPKEMERFETYLDLKEENGVLDEIKDEIKLLLYNNKKLVQSTSK